MSPHTAYSLAIADLERIAKGHLRESDIRVAIHELRIARTRVTCPVDLARLADVAEGVVAELRQGLVADVRQQLASVLQRGKRS